MSGVVDFWSLYSIRSARFKKSVQEGVDCRFRNLLPVILVSPVGGKQSFNLHGSLVVDFSSIVRVAPGSSSNCWIVDSEYQLQLSRAGGNKLFARTLVIDYWSIVVGFFDSLLLSINRRHQNHRQPIFGIDSQASLLVDCWFPRCYHVDVVDCLIFFASGLKTSSTNQPKHCLPAPAASMWLLLWSTF